MRWPTRVNTGEEHASHDSMSQSFFFLWHSMSQSRHSHSSLEPLRHWLSPRRTRVTANKKLIFAIKKGAILLLRQENLTGSLGGRRLDECEANEDAGAAAGVGVGAVHLRLVPPRLRAMGGGACSHKDGKNHGDNTRSHGSLPSPALLCPASPRGRREHGKEWIWEGGEVTAKGGEERRARKRPREEGTYTQKQSRAGPKRGAQLAGNGQWRFCSVALAETCSAACRGLVRRYRCEEVKHLHRIAGEQGREGRVRTWGNGVTAQEGRRGVARWGRKKRLGELCDRIDAFGASAAVALQLCALAAVGGWSPGLHCEREHSFFKNFWD